jgi:hypothetical protein
MLEVRVPLSGLVDPQFVDAVHTGAILLHSAGGHVWHQDLEIKGERERREGERGRGSGGRGRMDGGYILAHYTIFMFRL